MEDNFYKDEFETFLHEQADNYRMYPSDSIWRNINKKLHGDKTWPALTIVAFTFLAAIIAISVYFSPGPNIFAVNPPPQSSLAATKTSAPLITSISDPSDGLKANWQAKRIEISTSPVETDAEPSTDVTQQVAKIAQVKELFLSDVPVPNNVASIKTTGVLESRNSRGQLASKLGEAIITDNLNTQKLQGTDYSLSEIAAVLTIENKSEVKNINPQTSTSVRKANTFNTRQKKFSYKVYISPSKSYRNLKEDDAFQQRQKAEAVVGGPVAINYTAGVNQIVRHIPGNGVEAGVTYSYKLSKRLNVYSGLQFNIRQYFIEAYLSNPEMATIALQSRSGIDSVNKQSVYRTNNGYSTIELANKYYQLSMPVGLEYKVLGGKEISLNVAASVQPTYTLNNNAFLISTNFKNYTESGSIMRNWNINTAIEAFLSINSGNFNWQVGPQFRYQQLPTFSKQYPIKEHLMDYGVKIGVSKTIN